MKASEIKELLARRHHSDIFVAECKDGPTQDTGTHRRLDGLAIKKSWRNPAIIGYEIKVNRGDFLNDDKVLSYLPLCNELYYVCPSDLIKPSEVPESMGLLWVAKTGTKIYTKKKAPYRDIEEPTGMFRYIMYSRVRIVGEMGMPDEDKQAYWSGWLKNKALDRQFGWNVGKAIRERVEIEIDAVRAENKRLTGLIETYSDIRKSLSLAGIDPDGGRWSIQLNAKRKIDALRGVIPPSFGMKLRNMIRSAEEMAEALEEVEGK